MIQGIMGKRWKGMIFIPCCFLCLIGSSQSTVSTGNWSDANVWSTGVVPGPTDAITVDNPLLLDTDISISSGVYRINQDVFDLSGGGDYSLTMSGGSFEVTMGKVVFRDEANFSNASLVIRDGATLEVGDFTLDNGNSIFIESGGVLIVNGTLLNSNSSGSFVLDGLVQIYGDYDTDNGNLSITGNGNLFASGSIFNQGSSAVFGSNGDCSSGPCSGRNLCGFNNTIQGNQVICSGSAAMNLVSTANGAPSGVPTFVWESSTTSSTDGFSPAIGTNNAAAYSPRIVDQNTWYRRSVTLNGCTGYSNAVRILVTGGGGWRGVTTTWENPINWCSGTVPNQSTDVLIASGVSNQPVVSVLAQCRDIEVCPGSVLTLASGTLDIYGDFVNDGAVNVSGGTVSFSGSVTQYFSGDPITFYNLNINNSSPNTVIMSTMITVFNRLTMTLGNVDLSGYNLTLGTSSSNRGTLNRTSGTIYNGTLTRWFSTAVIAGGSNLGLFPVGNASNYRPLSISHTGFSGINASGGTIRVSSSDVSSTTEVSFLDGVDGVLRRHNASWNVSAGNGLNQGTATVPLTISVEGTGLGLIGDVDDLRLTLSTGVVGNAGTNAGTLLNPQVVRTNLSVTNLSNSFYVSSTNILQSPLPIVLESFSGRNTRDGNKIEWITASEVNVDYFVVERSKEGTYFEPVAQVSSQGQQAKRTFYTLIDTDLNEKSSAQYYRLKHVDMDGTFAYSPIIWVETYPGFAQESSSMVVFPNPVVGGKFAIRIEEPVSSGRFVLHDSQGRSILHGSLRQGEQDVFLESTIPSGLYFMKIYGTKKPDTIKVWIK